jgi:hypothetical protein
MSRASMENISIPMKNNTEHHIDIRKIGQDKNSYERLPSANT